MAKAKSEGPALAGGRLTKEPLGWQRSKGKIQRKKLPEEVRRFGLLWCSASVEEATFMGVRCGLQWPASS